MDELTKLKQAEEQANQLKSTPVLKCMKCDSTEQVYICEQGHATCYCHKCLKKTENYGINGMRHVATCDNQDCNFMPMNNEGGLVAYRLPPKTERKFDKDFQAHVISSFLQAKYKKFHFAEWLTLHIAKRFIKEREPNEMFDSWAQKHWVESVHGE